MDVSNCVSILLVLTLVAAQQPLRYSQMEEDVKVSKTVRGKALLFLLQPYNSSHYSNGLQHMPGCESLLSVLPSSGKWRHLLLHNWLQSGR